MIIKSKIIVLGGSKEQLEMIELCKSRGYYTIVLDLNENCLGRKIADKFHCLSIKDTKGILEIAKRESVVGITSMITEMGVISMYEVCEKLNLPQLYSYNSAHSTFSKNFMREVLNEHEINDIPSVCPMSKDDVILFAKKVGYPIIIKSSNSGGQNGLFIIYKEEEVGNKYKRSVEDSPGNKVIVEKFIEGDEINCVFTVLSNELLDCVISDRISDKDSPGVVKRHVYPSKYELEIKEKVKLLCQRLIDVFDIEQGVVFPQIIVDKNFDLYLIEIGTRIPGGIMNRLFENAVGFNLNDFILDISLDKVKNTNSYYNGNKSESVLVTFLNSTPGPLIVGSVKELIQNKKETCIESDFFTQEFPDLFIEKLSNGNKRFFYFINVGNNFEEAHGLSKLTYDNIDFLDENKRSLKKEGFDFNGFYKELYES